MHFLSFALLLSLIACVAAAARACECPQARQKQLRETAGHWIGREQHHLLKQRQKEQGLHKAP